MGPSRTPLNEEQDAGDTDAAAVRLSANALYTFVSVKGLFVGW